MPPQCRHGFWGHVSAEAEAGDVTVVESLFAPGATIPSHSHSCAYLSFVVAGRYREVLTKGSRTRARGTLAFHPAGEVHWNQFDEAGGRVLSVRLEARWLEGVSHVESWCAAPVRSPRISSIATQLSKELRQWDRWSAQAVQGLALQAYVEWRRTSTLGQGRPPAWLNEALRLATASDAPPLSVEEIAARVQIHPSHLMREFRRYFGCTIAEAARCARLERAQELLTRTSMPLGEIAATLGYSDQSHFSRAFKGALGSSPSEFRARR